MESLVSDILVQRPGTVSMRHPRHLIPLISSANFRYLNSILIKHIIYITS